MKQTPYNNYNKNNPAAPVTQPSYAPPVTVSCETQCPPTQVGNPELPPEKNEQPPLECWEPMLAVVDGCSNLNVRREPTTETMNVQHVITSGTEVYVVDAKDGWAQIQVPGTEIEGFVLMDYIVAKDSKNE